MQALALVLLSLFGLNARAQGTPSLDSLCNHPVQTVCEDLKRERPSATDISITASKSMETTGARLGIAHFTDWLNAEVLTRYNAFSKMNPESEEFKAALKEFEPAYLIYIQWLSDYQNSIDARLSTMQPDFSISRKRLADSLKAQIDSIEKQSNIPGTHSHFEIVTAEYFFEKWQKDPSVDLMSLRRFVKLCRLDGALSNAQLSKSPDQIVICPGYFLSFSQSSSPRSLLIAPYHEVGHLFDFDSNSIRITGPINRKAEACYTQNYADQLASSKDVLEYWNKIEPEMKALGDSFQSKVDSLKQRQANDTTITNDTINEAIDDLNAYEYTNSRYTRLKTWLKYDSLNDHDKVDHHINEIIADAYSAKALANDIEGMPLDDKIDFISHALQYRCPTRGKQFSNAVNKLSDLLWGPFGDGDDGTHPSGKFRIENLMRSPDLRQALGCTPLVDQIWCGP